MNYNYFGNSNSGVLNRRNIIEDEFGDTLSNLYDEINTSNKFNQQSFDYSLNYKKTFEKEDQELDISADFSNGKNASHYEQTQKDESPDSIDNASYGNNPGNEYEKDFSLDYTQPLRGGALLQTGAKAVFDDIKSTSDIYLLNPAPDTFDYSVAQSSVFEYKSAVYAAYVSGTFKLFKAFNVITGLRDEYTTTSANLSNTGKVDIAPYNFFAPSLTIAHSFKNSQSLQISYTRRIERPEYRDLNPFINASDPQNIITGNPELKPEIGNNAELKYSVNFKKGASIYSTIFLSREQE